MKKKWKKGLSVIVMIAMVLSVFPVVTNPTTSRASETQMLQNTKGESGMTGWTSDGGFSAELDGNPEDYEPGENYIYYFLHTGNQKNIMSQDVDISSLPEGTVFRYMMNASHKDGTYLELHQLDSNGKVLERKGGSCNHTSNDALRGQYWWVFKRTKVAGAVTARIYVRCDIDKQNIYEISLTKDDEAGTTTAQPVSTAAPTPAATQAPTGNSSGAYIYLGNVAVTDSNKSDILGDGKASFDSSTYTLNLNGVNVTTVFDRPPAGDTGDEMYHYHCSINSQKSLTIVLTGDNYLKLPSFSDGTIASNNAVNVNGNLTIKGNGTLNVSVGDSSYIAEGIAVEGGLTHESGTVNIVVEKAKYSWGVTVRKAPYAISGNARLTVYAEKYPVNFVKGITYGAETLVKAGSSGTDITFTATNPEYSKIGIGSFVKYVELTCGGSGGGTTTPAPGTTAAPGTTTAPSGTSSPTQTTAPSATPSPTPTDGGGGGTTTVVRSTPKFVTYWTNNQDVLNIYSTSGAKVTVKATNKLAKSKYVKKIKNGKTAKIIFRHYCKKGKYKFRFSCAATASYYSLSKGWTITVS